MNGETYQNRFAPTSRSIQAKYQPQTSLSNFFKAFSDSNSSYYQEQQADWRLKEMEVPESLSTILSCLGEKSNSLLFSYYLALFLAIMITIRLIT